MDFYNEIIKEKKDNEVDEEMIYEDEDRSNLKSREYAMTGSRSGALRTGG